MSWLGFRKKRESWEMHAADIIATAMRASARKYVWRPNSAERVMEQLRDYAEADAKWRGAPPSNADLIKVIASLLKMEGLTADYWIPLDPQFALAEAA